MRSSLLVLAAVATLLIGHPATAQISITGNDFFSWTGETFLSSSVDTSNGFFTVDVGSAGANQTWDFSSLPVSDELFITNFFDPADTPYAADFPTANFVFGSTFQDDSSEANSFQYMFIDNDGLLELGNVIQFGDTTLFDVGEPFQVPLPLIMGSTFTDISVDSFSVGDQLFIDRDSTVNTVDAWGTATTPGGTFDVLRLRLDSQSSTEIYQADTLVFSDESSDIAYDWISNTHFIVAAIQGPDGGTDPNFTQAQAIQMLAAVSTDLAPDSEFREDALLSAVWPNPSSATTNISITAVDRGADLAVYDLLGRKVRTLPVVYSADPQTVRWDGTADSGVEVGIGVYIVQLRSDNRTESVKVVRIR